VSAYFIIVPLLTFPKKYGKEYNPLIVSLWNTTFSALNAFKELITPVIAIMKIAKIVVGY
jgi:hypothetical protein